MKDRIQTLDSFNDLSPLTDETLKGLGFEEVVFGTYEYIISSSYAGKLFLHTNIWKKEQPYVSLYLEHTYSDRDSPIQVAIYSNIGSVRMLLEALKGDE